MNVNDNWVLNRGIRSIDVIRENNLHAEFHKNQIVMKCHGANDVLPLITRHTSYHPCMQVGNVFGHVCLSVCLCVCLCVCVCLSVCLSVFLSVQTITFEPLDIETSFLVCRYILTISRSNLSIKVMVKVKVI